MTAGRIFVVSGLWLGLFATWASGEQLGDAWSDARNPIVKLFGGQRLDLWSLRPIGHPKPPTVHNVRWARNAIDYFILARLEEVGREPGPSAGRRALARRLFFDLTGLPPSPAELSEFLSDSSPEAYERLVERLLGSPRYGEHAARAWLDVIRYSDSNGFDWDEFRPRAWRFRDYVIRSFNADKPFDRFVREQLAGDELLDGPPRDSSEQDDLIATGYMRLGPHDSSAALFNEQARSRAELMADLTETTGSAFLGLSLSCCRCHNHKHDPLSQADHYRFRAFFEAVKFADDLPVDLAADQEAIRRHNAKIEQQLKPLQAEREALLARVKARLRQERVAKLTAEERAWLDPPPEKRTDEQKRKIGEIEKKVDATEKEVLGALTPEEKPGHENRSKQMDALENQKRRFTLGLLMGDAEGKPPVTRILFQGDPKQEREPVEPGFISALDPNPARLRPSVNPQSTGRRLTLADWIVSAENPLTARVLANRVWQGHFGEGLVATPNDFGLAGARPTHPELLDWLARELVREGWSMKKLHRLIVTSATYRQSASRAPELIEASSVAVSEMAKRPASALGAREPRFLPTTQRDAENHLLARQNLRRLSAEELRDALLAVSGSLVERRGGPPVWPELPPEVLQANPAFLDDNETKTKGWYASPRAEQGVRSVYLVQKRTVRVPFLETFDLPENATSCPRRNESVVAPQALSLLNSALAVEAARAMAARVERAEGRDPRAQVNRAFALALARSPEPREREAALNFLKERSLAELCRALLNLNEFIYLD